jgi:Flp pilus assembly protein TadD
MDFIDQAFKLSLQELPPLAGLIEKAPSPSATEALAALKYRLGEREEAKKLFDDLPKKHIYDVRTLVLRMRLAFSGGNSEVALALARLILDQNTDNQEALRTAGRICNTDQKFDNADRFWRQLAEVAPDDGEAALQVARIAARRGIWETVALYAELAQAAKPDALEPMRLRLDAALKSPDPEVVIRDVLPHVFVHDQDVGARFVKIIFGRDTGIRYADLVGKMRSAYGEHQELAELAQDAAKRWIVAGQSAEMAHRDSHAASFYTAALAIAPELDQSTDGLKRLTRSVLIEMRDAQKEGRNNEANEIAQKLQQLDPKNIEAAFFRGRHLLANDPASAIAHFQFCVLQEPENGWYRLNLARAQGRADLLLEAYDAFGDVLKCDCIPAYLQEAEAQRSQIAKALMRQGSAAFSEADFPRALAIFGKCCEFDEFKDRAEKMLAASRRSMLLQVKELYAAEDPETVSMGRALADAWPDNVQVWQMLARTLMNRRLHAEAIDAWSELTKLSPQDAHYHLQVARCCGWLNRSAEGVLAAQRALDLDPALQEAHDLVARLGLKGVSA